MVRDGRVQPASTYTGSGGLGAEVSDQVRDDLLLEQLDSGATIVLQGLHRIWPPLRAFTQDLAGSLGCAVQANAYLTPAGNTGFQTHYDTHDVFVLQIAGRKHWRIHEPAYADPLERQAWGGLADEVSAQSAGPPYLDHVMAPGDLLYLPRGWLHAASALGRRACTSRWDSASYALPHRRGAPWVSRPATSRCAAACRSAVDLTDPAALNHTWWRPSDALPRLAGFGIARGCSPAAAVDGVDGHPARTRTAGSAPGLRRLADREQRRRSPTRPAVRPVPRLGPFGRPDHHPAGRLPIRARHPPQWSPGPRQRPARPSDDFAGLVLVRRLLAKP